MAMQSERFQRLTVGVGDSRLFRSGVGKIFDQFGSDTGVGQDAGPADATSGTGHSFEKVGFAFS